MVEWQQQERWWEGKERKKCQKNQKHRASLSVWVSYTKFMYMNMSDCVCVISLKCSLEFFVVWWFRSIFVYPIYHPYMMLDGFKILFRLLFVSFPLVRLYLFVWLDFSTDFFFVASCLYRKRSRTKRKMLFSLWNAYYFCLEFHKFKFFWAFEMKLLVCFIIYSTRRAVCLFISFHATVFIMDNI